MISVMRIATVAAVVGIPLTACIGHDPPQPIATVQAQDANLDCATIQAEIQANHAKATELANEQGWTLKQWYRYGQDYKGAAERDAAALNARQEYLTTLAAERCVPPSAPQPPLQRQPRAKS